jgi:alpha-N-arabinofuranosidase
MAMPRANLSTRNFRLERVVRVDLTDLGTGVSAETDVRRWARFSRFSYTGSGSPGEPERAVVSYHNPIVPGFHPDPSICRVGDEFFLVTSSFALFPGIPVFRSTDLVNWELVGHVLDRFSQMASVTGMKARSGVYAPTIRHHEGRFYVTCTLVEGGGNFICWAEHPEGPWSEPMWLRTVHGIDPSPWFEDGRCWIVHNGAPEGPELYDGHRAIRIHEVDLRTGAGIGSSHVLVNGGTDLSRKPIWIEGPHLFKRSGYYYLVASEGGTAEDHSVVCFRSRSLMGPYESWAGNPILTQRDLRNEREERITCTGHADLVQLKDGRWWAVFLGCRPFEGDHYITGRETFLLPVEWPEGGWPVILPRGQAVPVLGRPPFPGAKALPKQDWEETFDGMELSPNWVTVRPPSEKWMELGEGYIALAPRAVHLSEPRHASLLARRVTGSTFTAETTMRLPPDGGGVEAGLAAFQDESHHFFLGVRTLPGRDAEAFLEVVSGGRARVIGRCAVTSEEVTLRLQAEGSRHVFSLRCDGEWQVVGVADGRLLSTLTAGGFQGVIVGMHARKSRAPDK